jgi:hypothetical protein
LQLPDPRHSISDRRVRKIGLHTTCGPSSPTDETKTALDELPVINEAPTPNCWFHQCVLSGEVKMRAVKPLPAATVSVETVSALEGASFCAEGWMNGDRSKEEDSCTAGVRRFRNASKDAKTLPDAAWLLPSHIERLLGK